MSSTLLQAFTFALADYVTEYKLLPTLYNNPRHGSLELPPSPRSINTVKFSDESSKSLLLSLILYFFIMVFFLAFILDRNIQAARTYTMDTIPTTPTIQSRRVSLKN